MKDKGLLAVLLVPAFLLLVPLVGMQVSDEWNWNLDSFIFAYVLMAGVGFAYRLVTRRSASTVYRLGMALALATAFLVVWVTAAVGIIGAENPANLLYGGVLAIGCIGACLARFSARGMARALFVTAFAQGLVPLIALVFWPTDFSPGVAPVFALNLIFSALFAGSALLFRHAARHTMMSGEAQAVA